MLIFKITFFLWTDKIKTNIIILDKFTEEHSFGWIFYWQEKDLKKDNSNFIVGNGLIIIEKATLDMYAMMTALPVNESIEIYLKDKNKLAKLTMDEYGNFDVVNL